MLDEKLILAAAEKFGYDVYIKSETGSTNDDLKKMAAQGAPSGTIVITDRQTAGKGRLGRSFFSPQSGVYMSLLLRPMTEMPLSLRYTVAAAVAVCRACEQVCSNKAEIKWVNDVYINGRKICGILTEGSIVGGRLDYAVIGIGTNITTPAGGFPEDIADRAGALFEYGKAPEGISERYAAALMCNLSQIFDLSGAVRDIMDEYRRRSFLPGRNITAVTADGEKPCKAIGITDDAELIVQYPDGNVGTLCSGEVSIRI